MFEATAYLIPAVAALAAPLLPRGWKAPAIGAGALAAWVMLAAGVSGAPFAQALRVCALGLAAAALCAGLAHQILSAGVMAALIGSVFLMSPAIAHAPARAPSIIGYACSLSPHASAAAALERDFAHERFFYAEQDPPAADYGIVGAPWYRAPLIYLAVGVPLIGLGLRRRRA